MAGVIFDLDQTLVDTSSIEHLRRKKAWNEIKSNVSSCVIYPGIAESIAFLSEASIPYSIVTKSPRQYCLSILSHFDISSKLVVAYHDVSYGRHKPKPDQILLALDKMGLSSDTVFSFGDDPNDIIASKEAGVKTVACHWGAAGRDLSTVNPDFNLLQSQELLPFLRKQFL